MAGVTSESDPKLRYAVVGILVGISLIWWAFAFNQSAATDALTNGGVAIFLFLPLYWIQNRSYRAVKAVQLEQSTQSTTIQELAETVEGVQEEVARTNLRVDELGSATLGMIDEQRSADDELLDSFEANPDWRHTQEIFDRARFIGAVSDSIGVQLGASNTWLWFATGTRPARSAAFAPALEIFATAPTNHNNEHQSVMWAPATTPEQFMFEVANFLKSVGIYPGNENFDASAIFSKLASSIRKAIELRHSAAQVGKIFAFVNDDWAITEFGLECLAVQYRIPRDTLPNTPYGEPPPSITDSDEGTLQRWIEARDIAIQFFDR
jgi:hypothetical protein